MYWIAVAAIAIAAGFDLRRREIPDAIPLVLLAFAVAAKAMGFHPATWADIGVGASVAFLASAALFFLGGLGGGDVKLLGALGAALGARAFLPFAIATGLFGGLAALLQRRGRGESGARLSGHGSDDPDREPDPDPELAYAPVMLAGLLSLLPLVWLAR